MKLKNRGEKGENEKNKKTNKSGQAKERTKKATEQLWLWQFAQECKTMTIQSVTTDMQTRFE